MSKTYRALVDLRYPATPDEVRAKKLGLKERYDWAVVKAGKLVSDMPPECAQAYLKDGAIEEVTPKAKKTKQTKEVTGG